MVTLDEYIKGLKQEIKEKGIKQKELAAILGTSPTRLSLTLSGKEGTLNKYRKIEKIVKEW